MSALAAHCSYCAANQSLTVVAERRLLLSMDEPLVEIGRINSLEVIKERDFGLFFEGGDCGEILLPIKQAPPGWRIGDLIDVFVYFDSDDRIIATTRTPKAQVGEFACLEVVDVNSVGAFLDWGLAKDLLVPFREQEERLELGRSYVVAVYFDETSERIVASTKLGKFIESKPRDLKVNDEVSLLIAAQTDLGYKAIIENRHWGMLYGNEVFRDLVIGEKVTGYVKKLRTDEKVDLTLQRPGYEKVSGHAEEILNKLKANDGFLPFSDKSAPELIYEEFGMSKGTFKKAIGSLYKAKLILIEKEGLHFLHH